MEKKELCQKLIEKINRYDKPIKIMEICGTHTMAIGKFGIRGLLNSNINLTSGPGCPVCVTPNKYIDYAYNLSINENITILTYGDMLRVPGSSREISLEKARAKGAKIKMLYSSLEALIYAKENPTEKVLFLGIGFETTTPATAILVKEAIKENIKNLYILSMHKLVKPVMKAILEDKELMIDGFICPGNVSVILGEEGFDFLTEFKCASAISGFEELDILLAINSIIQCHEKKDFKVKNLYKKVVQAAGNVSAKNIIEDVFKETGDEWRGLGYIDNSSLKLREKYEKFDIEKVFYVKDYVEGGKVLSPCRCGEVLKGKIKPIECQLFRKSCSPLNPIGPCMVSSEGTCAAYYKYM